MKITFTFYSEGLFWGIGGGGFGEGFVYCVVIYILWPFEDLPMEMEEMQRRWFPRFLFRWYERLPVPGHLHKDLKFVFFS